MGVNITTVLSLTSFIIEIGSTILLMELMNPRAGQVAQRSPLGAEWNLCVRTFGRSGHGGRKKQRGAWAIDLSIWRFFISLPTSKQLCFRTRLREQAVVSFCRWVDSGQTMYNYRICSLNVIHTYDVSTILCAISSGDIPNSMRCSVWCSPHPAVLAEPRGTLVEPWWNPGGRSDTRKRRCHVPRRFHFPS